MMSQLTFQCSSHNVGKQDGNVHESDSCPCFVRILKKTKKHGLSATFKHGKQRGNRKQKVAYFCLCTYVVYKMHRRASALFTVYTRGRYL